MKQVSGTIDFSGNNAAFAFQYNYFFPVSKKISIVTHLWSKRMVEIDKEDKRASDQLVAIFKITPKK